MYYQAWLTDEATNEWLTVGALNSFASDARHVSTYESKDDLRRFTQLKITKQPIGSESRELIVAEATIIHRP